MSFTYMRKSKGPNIDLCGTPQVMPASVAVADPGFDLRGGVDFVNGGGGIIESVDG